MPIPYIMPNKNYVPSRHFPLNTLIEPEGLVLSPAYPTQVPPPSGRRCMDTFNHQTPPTPYFDINIWNHKNCPSSLQSSHRHLARRATLNSSNWILYTQPPLFFCSTNIGPWNPRGLPSTFLITPKKVSLYGLILSHNAKQFEKG